MSSRVAVLGAGGHGKVVADVALSSGFEVLAFLDDAPAKVGTRIMDIPVLSWERFAADPALRGVAVALAIGDNRARERLAERICSAGFDLATLVHPTAAIARTAKLGRGTVVMAGAAVNPDAVVGDGCIVNTGAVVEHDCVVGAYAHLSPNASLGGGVKVGARTHLGLGAVALPLVRIGADVRVGAGAVVHRDVADSVTVAGVPARPARARSKGTEVKRIYLSVPHMGGAEETYVREAFASNWLSSVGPNLDGFEREFEHRVGLPCVALGSGTAAIHLGLRLLGVGPGDEVLVPTLTFVASVNPIRYLGAKPVLIDSDPETWMIDPGIVADVLERKAAAGKLPKAVMPVHLYGQSADMDPIMEACARYDVPVIEDAAEALGTLYKGKPAGTFGAVAAFSFNGNKIITTTGGGMLASPRREWVEKARFWSQQARDPGVAYEHTELGYNHRMSNVLAGIGRGQLQVLDDRVQQRREVAFRYRDSFAELPGITLMPQARYGLHTNWLSCFLIDPARFGASRDDIIRALQARNIESRPLWKPMHLQPLYASAERAGGDVAADLFRRGICLPSSSSLTREDQELVISTVRGCAGAGRLKVAG